MKTIYLLLCFTGFIMLNSCESEYDYRLRKAKHLVVEELNMTASENGGMLPLSRFDVLLLQLHKEIAFHAHLSGNEDAFLQELEVYKKQVLISDQRTEESGVLLSRYP